MLFDVGCWLLVIVKQVWCGMVVHWGGGEWGWYVVGADFGALSYQATQNLNRSENLETCTAPACSCLLFHIINLHTLSNIKIKDNNPITYAILFINLYSFLFVPIIARIRARKLNPTK